MDYVNNIVIIDNRDSPQATKHDKRSAERQVVGAAQPMDIWRAGELSIGGIANDTVP